MPTAARLLEALVGEGMTHLVGLPDTIWSALIDATEAHSGTRYVPVTREGEAFALAAGLWVGGAEPVVVVQNTGLLESGDSLLMTLGTLVTAATTEASNLVLFVIDNGTYEITGNQTVPGNRRVDYAGLAKAAGFPRAHDFDDPEEYENALPDLLNGGGPTLISLRVEPGEEGPISRSAEEESLYLQVSLEQSVRVVREALKAGGPPRLTNGPSEPSG